MVLRNCLCRFKGGVSEFEDGLAVDRGHFYDDVEGWASFDIIS